MVGPFLGSSDRLFLARPRQLHDALLHFPCRLVGERHSQDLARAHALADQIGDAVGDNARFACAGPGQNQNRAFGGFHGPALLRIERAQVQHRAKAKSKKLKSK